MGTNGAGENPVAERDQVRAVSEENRAFVRRMTVPQLIDLCGKRQWGVQIATNGPVTTIRITDRHGNVIGRSDSPYANEDTFSMALLDASRKPSYQED